MLVMINNIDDMKPICDKCNQIVSEFERAFDHRLRRHIFLAKCHGEKAIEINHNEL